MNPKEGDVAEDGKGNFLVFRGGEWYPAQQDGRPLERIPRPDYGANHFQLPNGDIVRQGPRGGQETVENFGGAGGGAGGSGLVSADQRGRYNIGAEPLVRAERNLAVEEKSGNPLNRDWPAVVLNAIDLDPRGDSSFRPFAPLANLVGGQDYQNAQQALSTYEASLMPIQSGASVTASEAARQIRADFPALGDSPETLRRKAANRRDRINAILAGIGRPPAFTDEEVANPTDQSTDREVAALASIGDGATAASTAPGSGPDNPVDISGMSGADLMALKPGQYVRFPDGRVEPLSGAPRIGAEGEEVAPGVFRSPEEAMDARREDTGMGRRADTFVRGAADTLTFGLSDEITAGLNTVAPLDRGTRGGWNGDWAGAYRQNLDQMRAVDKLDAEQMPLTRGAGQVAGGFAPGLGIARAATGGTRAVRAARAAGAGAGIGGAYGFGSGEGNALQRIPDAATGAGVGAAFGPVAAPIANALNRGVIQPIVGATQAGARAVARPVVNAFGNAAPAALREAVEPNPLASGINRFADRMGERRVSSLNQNLAARRAAGIDEATMIDTLDDASIGRVRALGTRDTEARDQAVRFAERRRTNLPSRTARIAREEISDDTRPALEILDSQRTIRRNNADAINTFGNDPVPLSNDAVLALRSDFVRPYLRDAATRAQGAIDPVEREASARLSRLVDTVLDDPAGARLTVREAQDISKALNDAATAAFRNGSPDGPVLSDLAKSIRGAARENSEGYRNWLSQYGEDSDLMEAATRGRNFVSVNKDPVNARGTEAFVRGAANAGDAEMAIQRAASAEAVSTAGSNPSGARSVLDAFANDTDQFRRTAALGVDAGRVQSRAQAEIDAVTRAQRASPRVGSESSTNLQDAGNAGGRALQALGNPLRAGATWAANRLASRGFNDAEAEAIVKAAIDPAQTERLIGMLSERMSRREARRLARAVRYQLTTAPQPDQQ